MRTETTTLTVELGEEIDGEFVPNGQTVEVTSIDIFADEGKKFKRLSDNVTLSNHISLGTNDSIDDYIEVDAVEQGETE